MPTGLKTEVKSDKKKIPQEDYHFSPSKIKTAFWSPLSEEELKSYPYSNCSRLPKRTSDVKLVHNLQNSFLPQMIKHITLLTEKDRFREIPTAASIIMQPQGCHRKWKKICLALGFFCIIYLKLKRNNFLKYVFHF